MSLKKTIAICCMALACSSCFAQEEVGTFTIQPKAGICIPTNDASSDAIEKDSHRKVCFTGGAELEYQFSKKFSATIGAMYSHENITQAKWSESVQENSVNLQEYDLTSKLDFINVPVMINFYPIKGLTIKAGIQTNITFHQNYNGLNANYTDYRFGYQDGVLYEYTPDPDNYVENFYNYGCDINNVSVSIPVGLSYEFKHFVLDARYNIGLSKVIKNNFTGTSYKGSCFYITLGYKFAL